MAGKDGKEGAEAWVVPACRGEVVPPQFRDTWDRENIQGNISSHNWTTLHSACAIAHGYHHDRALANQVCDAILNYYPKYGLQGGETGSSWRYGDWHLGPYLVWEAVAHAIGRSDTLAVIRDMLTTYRLISALTMGWESTSDGWPSTYCGSRSWITNTGYPSSNPDKYRMPDGKLKPPQPLCIDRCGYHDNHTPAYLGLKGWVYWQKDIYNAIRAGIPDARGFEQKLDGEKDLFRDLVSIDRPGKNAAAVDRALAELENRAQLKVGVYVIRTTNSVAMMCDHSTNSGSTSFLHARPWFRGQRPADEYQEWWAGEFKKAQGWLAVTPHPRKAGKPAHTAVGIGSDGKVYIEAECDEGGHWDEASDRWKPGPKRRSLLGEPVLIALIKKRGRGVERIFPADDTGEPPVNPPTDPKPPKPPAESSEWGQYLTKARKQLKRAIKQGQNQKGIKEANGARNNIDRALDS